MKSPDTFHRDPFGGESSLLLEMPFWVLLPEGEPPLTFLEEVSLIWTQMSTGLGIRRAGFKSQLSPESVAGQFNNPESPFPHV